MEQCRIVRHNDCRTFHATDATLNYDTVAFLAIFNDTLDWCTASCCRVLLKDKLLAIAGRHEQHALYDAGIAEQLLFAQPVSFPSTVRQQCYFDADPGGISTKFLPIGLFLDLAECRNLGLKPSFRHCSRSGQTAAHQISL